MSRIFTAENAEHDDLEFHRYRKSRYIRAARVNGPFIVETREGPLRCENGFLAIDEDGWPYPIRADQMAYYEVQEPSE